MDDIAYREYAEESADWLKNGRASLVSHLVGSNRPRDGALEILELGAGVGQNIPVLTPFGAVDAIEVSSLGQEKIRAQGLVRELFTDPVPFEMDRAYDIIVALDVIEHLEDDVAALRWIADHLRPGGLFVATVPAYPWLFSDHDRALHHFRRYTRASFRRALPDDLQVVTAAYFNHLLFPAAVAARGAWSLKRMLRPGGSGKQRSPKSGPLAAVLGKALEAELALIRKGYEPAWGLSVYCVARRA